MVKLLFFGPPGSGKGTYATRIGPILGIVPISTGEIFRAEVKKGTELGKKADQIMRSGALMPDEITLKIIENRLKEPDAKRGFIADGFPRTIPQAEAMQSMVRVDALVNLVVPERVIVGRLSSRESCRKCGKIYNKLFLKSKVEGKCDECGGELYVREDDKPESIRQRIKAYEQQTEPLLEYYQKKTKVPIIDIECNDINVPPEIMVDKILAVLKQRGII